MRFSMHGLNWQIMLQAIHNMLQTINNMLQIINNMLQIINNMLHYDTTTLQIQFLQL